MTLLTICICMGILAYVEFVVRPPSRHGKSWVKQATKRYEEIISKKHSRDDLLDLRFAIKDSYKNHVGFDPELISLVLNLLICIDRQLDKIESHRTNQP